MPTQALPPPILVQNKQDLNGMLARLKDQPLVAVDTESNSLHAYRERVCLIQFSIPGADMLVDPLAISDLRPLAKLFANPAVEKVLHAAEYDLICLKRDFGFNFHNLFDTRIACRTLGRKRSGLGDVLAEAFGVELNKRFQRANWGRRPLTPEMLDYARLDTHYLLPLRQLLSEELRSEGHWEEASEAFLALSAIEVEANGFDPQGFWRISNSRQLSPEQTAVLRELYLLREKHAKRLDRPPFKVIGDKTLLAIAQDMPADSQALSKLSGMTPRQVQHYGQDLLATVERGRQSPHPKRPRTERLDERVIARYEVLRNWRKLAARSRQVESDIVLPRDLVWKIARAAPRDPEALRKLMQPFQWRFKTYGEDILKALWEQ
jgi:ribonuclease D